MGPELSHCIPVDLVKLFLYTRVDSDTAASLFALLMELVENLCGVGHVSAFAFRCLIIFIFFASEVGQCRLLEFSGLEHLLLVFDMLRTLLMQEN